MACDVRVGAFANVTVTVQVSKDGTSQVPQTTVRLPRIGLASPAPPPAGLKHDGRFEPETPEITTGGNFSVTTVPIVGSTYTGSINSLLKFRWVIDVYSDCAAPVCVKGKVTGIRANVHYEYGATAGFDLVSTNITNPDVPYGGPCETPPWTLCCRGTQTVPLDLSEFALINNDLTFEIDGECTVEYEIYVRTTEPERTRAAFHRPDFRKDGTVMLALRSDSVKSVMPLPAKFGGGKLTVSDASGYVVLRPGDKVGCIQQLDVVELSYRIPSQKLEGVETGAIVVALAPESRARGQLDHCSGLLQLDVPQIIRAPVLGDGAILVNSTVTGFYDAVSGEAEILTFSFDKFPELPTRPDKENAK